MTVIETDTTVEITMWRVQWKTHGPVSRTYKSFASARVQYNRRAEDHTLQGMEFVDEGPVSHVGAEEGTSSYGPSTRKFRVTWWGETVHSLAFTTEEDARKFRTQNEHARTFISMTKHVTTYYR